MSIGARRRPEDLSTSDLERLRQAHKRLRDAVKAAERYGRGELPPGIETPVHRQEDIEAAYRKIDEAEAELWRMREELLGWKRPGSALPARDVLDWFSEEDEVYDSEE
ncbi:MAG: hypothetical protein ACRDI1_03305 [Actinomycetota bacterium]